MIHDFITTFTPPLASDTVSGSVNVSGTVQQVLPLFQVAPNNIASIGPSWTTLTSFATPDYNVLNLWSTANNRVEAPLNGYYSITFTYAGNTSTNGCLAIDFMKNGSAIYETDTNSAFTTSTYFSMTLNRIVYLTTTDYLTVRIYSGISSGVSLTSGYSSFSGFLISRA